MPGPDVAICIALLAANPLFEDAPHSLLVLCADLARTVDLASGEILIRTGTTDHAIHLVLQGRLQVYLAGSAGAGPALAELGAGDVIGEIQAVTGQAATADVVAESACSLLRVDAAGLQRLCAQFPPFEDRLTAQASSRLRRTVFQRSIQELLEGSPPALVRDFVRDAVEVELERGASLFRQGDAADAWYVLTSGRLGVVAHSPEGERVVASHSPGAIVGEMALLSGGARTASIVAERKATLMRLSRADFERFAECNPAFARRLMGLVVHRITHPSPIRSTRSAQLLVVLRSDDAPALDAALQQLGGALQQETAAALLTRQGFQQVLGRKLDFQGDLPEGHPVWNRFDVWLEEARQKHALLLLDAGCLDDAWSRECLLHADQCIWLAEPLADDAPGPPAAHRERLLAAQRFVRHKTQALPWWLLLAHPAATLRPRNTRAWIAQADFARNLHLRLDDAESTERAARLLSGRATGLALSGGGARGLAHVGVLKAFVEAGVPIDCIGGTSMGAIQAGMFAMGLTIPEMEQRNRQVIAQKAFQEYTLPFVSLVASRRRDACFELTFGDQQIEDLWIPYLAVSTDLHAASEVIHERGSLRVATAASSSVPGVLVPVLDGERILVDGGIVNNLPADLVKARCGGTVFASNVSAGMDMLAPQDGFPSTWSLFWRHLLRLRRGPRAPMIGDIITRTMTVAGAKHMQRVRLSLDVLVEPDVARYGMLHFHAIGPLMQEGHESAVRCLAQYQAGGARVPAAR